jgi:Ca2+-transporting ATPase
MIFSGTSGNLRAWEGRCHCHRHAHRNRTHRRTPETDADEPTPLQRELDRTGKVLGLVVVAIAISMIATIIVVEDVHGCRLRCSMC